MNAVKNWLREFYGKQGLWTLFLMVAFPIHVWALILYFWDFSWIEESRGTWNAIGVGNYAMLIALVESLTITFGAAWLGLLVAPEWSAKQRISVLIIATFLASAWTMLGQAYFLFAVNLPAWMINLIGWFPRPLVLIYAVIGGVVFLTISAPVWFALNSEKFLKGLDAVVERLSLLTGLYLVIDLISIVLIAYRNNFWL